MLTGSGSVDDASDDDIDDELSIDIECYRCPLQHGSCTAKGVFVCVGACTIDADDVYNSYIQ